MMFPFIGVLVVVCLAVGFGVGSSGTVPKGQYDQLRQFSDLYEKYWKETAQERDGLRRERDDAMRELMKLKGAIRNSRKALDNALPPEITHTVQ